MSRHQYIRILAYHFIFLLGLCSVESVTSLTIFYSGEENGQLGLHGCGSEQIGGLAHRHTLLLDLRTELDAVLNLHTGNLIDATDGDFDFSAEWIYQIGLSALDVMGVDVLCLGPQELSFSSETLAALHTNHPNIAFTCANARNILQDDLRILNGYLSRMYARYIKTVRAIHQDRAFLANFCCCSEEVCFFVELVILGFKNCKFMI